METKIIGSLIMCFLIFLLGWNFVDKDSTQKRTEKLELKTPTDANFIKDVVIFFLLIIGLFLSIFLIAKYKL